MYASLSLSLAPCIPASSLRFAEPSTSSFFLLFLSPPEYVGDGSRTAAFLRQQGKFPFGQHLAGLLRIGEEVVAAELVGHHHPELADTAIAADTLQARAVELLAAGAGEVDRAFHRHHPQGVHDRG